MVMHIGWILQKHVKEPNLESRSDITGKKITYSFLISKSCNVHHVIILLIVIKIQTKNPINN